LIYLDVIYCGLRRIVLTGVAYGIGWEILNPKEKKAVEKGFGIATDFSEACVNNLTLDRALGAAIM
jgi:hypothetical protein